MVGFSSLGRTIIASLVLGIMAVGPGRTQESVEERIDTIVEELFALGMTPGMAVAVVRGDEVVYSRGLGVADVETGRQVDDDTLFYLASVTKSFTGLAVALLDHQELVDLDAPISDYLPQLELAPPLSADEITMRDLVTLSHGIDQGGPVAARTAYSGDYTTELLLELLADYGPSEHGRAFVYDNLGFVIAGMVIEAERGESWKDVVDRLVLAPAGMTSTTAWASRADPERLAMPHAPTPEGFRRLPYTKADANMHAAGGHLTTADDMARWLLAQINEGRIDGEQVFPAGVIAETQRLQVEQDREFSAYHRHGWGLGWDLATYDGDLMIHRFGTYAGFRPHVSFLPEHDLGVVVLVNDGTTGGMLVDLVANAIYDELLGKADTAGKRAALAERTAERVAFGRQRMAEDMARRAERSQDLLMPLAAYAGAYESRELGRLEVRLVDDRLEVAWGLVHSPAEVYDAATHKLRVELTGRGEVISFAPADGQARSLTYDGYVFERVDG